MLCNQVGAALKRACDKDPELKAGFEEAKKKGRQAAADFRADWNKLRKLDGEKSRFKNVTRSKEDSERDLGEFMDETELFISFGGDRGVPNAKEKMEKIIRFCMEKDPEASGEWVKKNPQTGWHNHFHSAAANRTY